MDNAINVSAIVCVKSLLMNCADIDDVTQAALEPRVTSSVVVPVSGKFDMRCRRPRGLPTPTCWSVYTCLLETACYGCSYRNLLTRCGWWL